MKEKFDIRVDSEIGKLNGVILHTPGKEVENMTPGNAERALYSDILNLSVARKEYEQFEKVLKKVTRTFQVRDLLKTILSNEKVKESLIEKIVFYEDIADQQDILMSTSPSKLSDALIEGVVMRKDNLTKFLNKERYSLKPLHNFFFTRDASVTVSDFILISNMKNKIRSRESFIMEAIFDYHPLFSTSTVAAVYEKYDDPGFSIEGGDILIIREDIILIGVGARTSSMGVDFIIDQLNKRKKKCEIIVQELPLNPESFIHLDMVFTMLDRDKCMVYEPIVIKPNKYQTVHISLDNGKVDFIRHEKNILTVLKKLGMNLEPILCGGSEDLWTQEREQWHSGANFFAFGEGKVIGYDRNINTIEALSKKGFEIISASDFLKEDINLDTSNRYVITVDGSELARGGGGCRCMTMPIGREKLS